VTPRFSALPATISGRLRRAQAGTRTLNIHGILKVSGNEMIGD